MTQQSRHIIFDLDGTLLDTEYEVACITADLATEQGCAISADEVFRDFSGLGSREKFTEIAESRGVVLSDATLDTLSRLHEERKGELSKGSTLPVNPHVPETLEDLKQAGDVISLCSSNPTQRSKLCLETAGLSAYFNERVYGPDLVAGRKKPDPASYLLAMEENGSDAANTVVVEDSEPGIVAGKKAHAFVIAYLDPRFGTGVVAEAKKQSFREAGADIVIRDFKDFKAALPQQKPNAPRSRPPKPQF